MIKYRRRTNQILRQNEQEFLSRTLQAISLKYNKAI